MSVCGAKDSKYYPDAQHSTGTYTLLRSEQEVPSTRIYMFTNTNTDTHTNTPCFEQNNGGGWVLNQSLPVLHHVGDFNANASANAQYLKSTCMVDKDATAPDMQHRSSFYVLRTILKSASYMNDTVEAVKKALPALKFVDPYTMGLLVKCESGAIDCTLKK